MGGNCCVAMRDKPLLDDPRFEVPSYRNFRCSPSWSFRWDNRTHIEDIVESTGRVSRYGGGDVDSDSKSGAEMEMEMERLSSEGSPVSGFGKSSIERGVSLRAKDCGADQSIGSNTFPKETGPIKSANSASASDASTSNSDISVPSSSTIILGPSSSKSDISVPSSSTIILGPSSSKSDIRHPDSTPSRHAHCSPGYQISRQISDSRIQSLQSLNENNSPQVRRSFVFSTSGNDLSMAGSQGRSSDGWSMQAFTELMASSQRERWSFDSEYPSSIEGKFVRSNTQPLPSVTPTIQTCGVCAKLIKERSSWSSSNEIAVVAVLVCGHVCHADCLEGVTLEADRFEPHCPVCGTGEKSVLKSRKDEFKSRSKISRIAVADGEEGFGHVAAGHKDSKKGSRFGASSSAKSPFSGPFFKRHFSIGPRTFRSASENETRKKGFWTKYRRN